MILGTHGDNQLLFKIAGYQFPNNRNNEFDANWLMITIDLTTPQGHWEKTDPSLLTWEVQSLIDWLEAVVIDKEEWNAINFTEPNLSFCILDKEPQQITLGLGLALEGRPPFLVSSAKSKATDIVEILCSRTELKEWITYLQNQLAEYALISGDFCDDL